MFGSDVFHLLDALEDKEMLIALENTPPSIYS